MKSILTGVLLVGIAAGSNSGCSMLGGSSKSRMNASSVVPAAEGVAKFGKAPNGNTSIDLTVKHLADPQKLTPAASNYVVWLRADRDASAQNIGALSVDKDLVGRLKTVTALRSFDLSVTAEASGQAQDPTGEPLLWTSHND